MFRNVRFLRLFIRRGGVGHLPTVKSKNLSTIVHVFLCTCHVIAHRVDVVHYFTTRATLFAPLLRLLGIKVVCSVDGTDWQRAKWGHFARWYLRFPRSGGDVCHGLISDSNEVMNYYRKNFGAASSCIVYGMREHNSKQRDVLDRFGLGGRDYILFVGRLVLKTMSTFLFARSSTLTDRKLVIVGDDPWEKSTSAP
jgi:hypothetical protein